MGKAPDRFLVVHEEGGAFGIARTILVDRQTGVNYLWVASGYGGGLTVLLNRDGTPVVTALPIQD